VEKLVVLGTTVKFDVASLPESVTKLELLHTSPRVVFSLLMKLRHNLSDLKVTFNEDALVEYLDFMTIFHTCARLSALSIKVCGNAEVILHGAKDLSKLHFADLQQ
jgi:hypothetical protein